jgi:hypothetical protein
MRFGRRLGNLNLDQNIHDWSPNETIQATLTPKMREYRNSDTLERIDSADDIATRIRKENRNYTLISIKSFGYINCDHFKSGNLTRVQVPIENLEDDVRLFFSNFQSAAKLTNEDSYASFNNLPANEKVKMVFIHRENGVGTMSLSEQSLQSRMQPGPLEPYSLEKIKVFLEGIEEKPLQ